MINVAKAGLFIVPDFAPVLFLFTDLSLLLLGRMYFNPENENTE